ncbi:hypothetical protein ACH3PA_04030 [Leeuwenhoekiella sp. A2]|uniref:hypothetical protein n=1 Tax=Leeuwenhoekiella sp. A2 TaxID=3141460 RepID=UPI003A80B965
MGNYERKIYKEGKDTGVREDYRGAMYIDHKVFFSDEKVQKIIKNISKAGLVKKDQNLQKKPA